MCARPHQGLLAAWLHCTWTVWRAWGGLLASSGIAGSILIKSIHGRVRLCSSFFATNPNSRQMHDVGMSDSVCMHCQGRDT